MEGQGAGCARRRRRLSVELDPGRIDLWYACIDDIEEAGLLARYRTLLGAQELARMERLHFARDRRRDLVARALVRTVLSRYAALAPREWAFCADANGRPRIANPPPGPGIEFNLSHSGGLVVLCVGTGRALGVDVESISRNTDTDRLERYFAPRERGALLGLPEAERRRRFFELWTLKESYLKARGEGLRLALDAFAFDFTGERGLRLSFERRLADSPCRWRFWQFTPRTDYLVAVCAGRGEPSEGEPRLTVREVVPLAWEKVVEVGFARSGPD